MKHPIRIGTRGSKLAVWQAEWVKSTLLKNDPSVSVELVIIKTRGDKILDVPLAKVGGKGLFVKEIEDALLSGHVDLAVHSMKDMPVVVPDGLCIGAVPERESPHDVLISKDGMTFSQMPRGARIGTSSLRRGAQLRHIRPDIEILSLRGNLDTRLKKLHSENLNAIILAAAGIKRLNLDEHITEYLDESVMLPAVGQGALCIECRNDDAAIRSILTPIDHERTRQAVFAERSFLRRLEGGCQVPIAALGAIAANELILTGLVADVDGSRIIRRRLTGAPEDYKSIGLELAEQLLSLGAKPILDQLKAEFNEDRSR